MMIPRLVRGAALFSIALTVCTALSSPTLAQEKKSKNPPEGAPWVKQFADARAQALRDRTPIFLYSTKTY